jgi:hypothetical protein
MPQAGGARLEQCARVCKNNVLLARTDRHQNATKFYQAQLEKYLSQSQLITLKLLVWLLQSHKQVKIERLAATLP